ncbi:glycosyltransferase family 2 protein (plasmid) [Halorussus vallis]|uniref:glycosyltransferase family 2 protein n=1 Tax=Halorussus vallis TaxID=2953749 RepID=UPI0020A148F8|nr:glycosyltransferase family 2 protein [Halorussus vallis]USZ78246.1 glycosyltransferase family 2 protein [Halorussus vallis]
MYRDHTVGVVVPAYNEEGHVGAVLDEIPAFVDRVYVVDDASTDGTWDEICAYAETADAGERAQSGEDGAPADESEGDAPAGAATAADGGEPNEAGRGSEVASDGGVAESGPTVVPIRHEENRGAGGALKTGYLRAREEGVDVTVTIDADGQMDPGIMPRFLDPIVAGEADYTKGNRLANPAYREEMPRFRQVGNWILTYLTRIASGYWRMSDPQNGYTAVSLEALWAIDLEGMYEYYGYCNDVLVKLNAAGMTVADVSMPAKYGDEESSIDYVEYIPKVSGMLFRNFCWRLRERYGPTDPVSLAYGAGTAGGLLAAGSALAAARRAAASAVGSAEDGTEDSDGDTASAAARNALGALFAGTLAVLAGMALDARANEGREAHEFADREGER